MQVLSPCRVPPLHRALELPVARCRRPLGEVAVVTALLVASWVLSSAAVGLSAQVVIILTRRLESPDPVVLAVQPDFDVAGLVAGLVRLVEVHATRVATAALAAIDQADLLGVDEADVLRRLAVWRAELVAAGRWSETTETAARATIARHRALNGGPS